VACDSGAELAVDAKTDANTSGCALSSGEPGARTIWQGLTKGHIAAETMRLLRDDGNADISV
jgi:hypothetical protein